MNWPAFWQGFGDGFTAGPLRRFAADFIRGWNGPATSTLEWHCQQVVWAGIQESALLHYARAPDGTFEIFEDGESYLLHFPRSRKMPAELFYSLEGAKERAAVFKDRSVP